MPSSAERAKAWKDFWKLWTRPPKYRCPTCRQEFELAKRRCPKWHELPRRIPDHSHALCWYITKKHVRYSVVSSVARQRPKRKPVLNLNKEKLLNRREELLRHLNDAVDAEEKRRIQQDIDVVEQDMEILVENKPFAAVPDVNVQRGYRLPIPRNLAAEINQRVPGSLRVYERSRHGTVPVANPPRLATFEEYHRRREANLRGMHIWRSWPPTLIAEIVQLIREGRLRSREHLPKGPVFSLTETDGLVKRPPNHLESELSEDGRFLLLRWCEAHDCWGRLLRLPGSMQDVVNANVFDGVCEDLRRERSKFNSDKAFLEHLLNNQRTLLERSDLPKSLTRLRHKLKELGVLGR